MNNLFLDFLDAEIQRLTGEESRLSTDDRDDEAVFARVQRNVYELFRTVYLTGDKVGRGDDFFAEKLKEIPENWMKSYKRAEEFHDGRKAHIEKLKLAVRDEIRREFDRLRRNES